jgi:putative DNA methylase
MGERKANKARLKLATEFKKTQMKTGDEFAGSLTRAVLYAMYEINNKVEITDVLAHLATNYQRYIENNAMLVKVANYIYQKRKDLKATKSFPCDKDAEAAHILAEALANQRL